MTHEEAEAYCKPWDRAVCAGENVEGKDGENFIASLVSTPLKGEMEDAVLKAFKKACLKPQTPEGRNLFWSGGDSISSRDGKVTFTDRSRAYASSINSLESDECVAFDGDEGTMVAMKCGEKLPFMCKIQPPVH